MNYNGGLAMETRMAPTHDKRPPWQNQFETPTIDDLRTDLPLPSVELFDEIRTAIMAYDNIVERKKWYGDCWFWTLGFYLEDEATEEDLPVLLLIPAPEDLQVAMPFDGQCLEELNTRRMKRAIRDGLDLAREPYSTEWAIWPLNARNMLDDLYAIIRHRLHWLRGT